MFYLGKRFFRISLDRLEDNIEWRSWLINPQNFNLKRENIKILDENGFATQKCKKYVIIQLYLWPIIQQQLCLRWFFGLAVGFLARNKKSTLILNFTIRDTIQWRKEKRKSDQKEDNSKER
jgi:hypothetical protein